MKETKHQIPKKNFDFNAKSIADSKISQLGIHLETLLEYGINFRDRIITIKGEIDEKQFALVDAGLSEMESASRKAVTIRINSQGGSVYDALAIVGRLRASKCKIITEGYGEIMSAATLILACGHERKMSEFGWFMTHESSYAVEGKHSDVKNYVKQAEREEAVWNRYMAKFSKQDEKFWAKVNQGVDTFYSPEQLKEIGVIDEVI